jgi:hypothetical protein
MMMAFGFIAAYTVLIAIASVIECQSPADSPPFSSIC